MDNPVEDNIPLNRKDLERDGLAAKEAIEYIHDQIVLCLDATEDPDVDVHKVQQRYSDLAEKLRHTTDPNARTRREKTRRFV
jgi:hypothetical protein